MTRSAAASPSDLPHCTFTTTPFRSSITGREVWVNLDASRFAIGPRFDDARLAAARSDWNENVREVIAREEARMRAKDPEAEVRVYPIHLGLRNEIRPKMAAVFDATDATTLARRVDALLACESDLRASKGVQGEHRRILELLTLLWKHGLLAFPGGAIWGRGIQGRFLPDLTARFYGGVAAGLRALGRDDSEAPGHRGLRLMFLSCGGAEEPGDIDARVQEALQPVETKQRRRRMTEACRLLRDLHGLAYRDQADLLARVPDTYRPTVRPKPAPRPRPPKPPRAPRETLPQGARPPRPRTARRAEQPDPAYSLLTAFDAVADADRFPALQLPAEPKHVHFGFTAMRSTITGRDVLVNLDSTRFSVLPDFDPECLERAAQDWREHLRRQAERRKSTRPSLIGLSETLRTAMAQVLGARDGQTFAAATECLVDLLVSGLASTNRGGRPLRIVELLTILWKHGLIAFPAGYAWRRDLGSLMFADAEELFYGGLAGAFRQMAALDEGVMVSGRKPLVFMLLACGRMEAIGDMDLLNLRAFQPFAPDVPRWKSDAAGLLLRDLQVAAYPANDARRSRVPLSYRSAFEALPDGIEEAGEGGDLRQVHFDVTPVQSAITGRTVLVNVHRSRVAVLPDFSAERLHAAAADWEIYYANLRSRGSARYRRAEARADRMASGATVGVHRDNERLIRRCLSAGTVDSFAAALDALLNRLAEVEERAAASPIVGSGRSRGRSARRSGEAKRLVEVLFVLWKHGVVALPAGQIWEADVVPSLALPDVTEQFLGSFAEPVLRMHAALKWAGEKRPAIMILAACGGMQEIGDVDEGVVGAVAPFAPTPPGHIVYALCDQLRTLQLGVYHDQPVKREAIPQSYRLLFKSHEAPRSDREFQWAVGVDGGGPRMERWRAHLAGYVASLPKRASLRTELNFGNALLDYAITTPGVPNDPVEYCLRAYSPSVSFAEWMEEKGTARAGDAIRKAVRFFDFVLEPLRDEDEILPREYRNPISDYDIPDSPPSKGQTHRRAIPVRFIRRMREIILSPGADGRPTFAWPRSLESDYFLWHDHATGETRRIWSPVRAVFYLVRLELPIRGFQTRMLDSGEGDEFVFRPEEGGWIRNAGRWAEPGRQLGFVRRIWDAVEGKYYNGLWITTNKTQDRETAFVDPGYEIPWENSDIIGYFTYLRDWQERYNPSSQPMSRAELSDPRLVVSHDVASRLDRLHFLFRDAAYVRAPMEPPTDGRLSTFWRMLVQELEHRLERDGVTNDDGSKIILVTGRRESGFPTGTIFDPHSLRVAGLTALAGAGVPIHILSEFVAGHATILMTLYYQKPNAGEITRVLYEALLNMAEVETTQWIAYLKNQPLEILHELAVYNSEAGLLEAQATQSALYGLLDFGFCPNGCTKCAEGGPRIEKKGHAHAPVPGGKKNCVLCRFFVTGGPFLGGLVAKYNATVAEAREALSLLRERMELRRTLFAQREEMRRAGGTWGAREQRRLDKAEEEIETSEREVNLLGQILSELYRLIEQSKTALRKWKETGSSKHALVAAGQAEDVVTGFVPNASEFDLLDRVCQTSDIYTSIDVRVPALRRGRMIDAALGREGVPALCASLTERELIDVGNAATSFLRTVLGDTGINDLIDGRSNLSEHFGLDEELAQVLSRELGRPVAIRLPRREQGVPVIPRTPAALPPLTLDGPSV